MSFIAGMINIGLNIARPCPMQGRQSQRFTLAISSLLFIWWEQQRSHRCFDFGELARQPKHSAMRYLIFQVLSGVLLLAGRPYIRRKPDLLPLRP